MTRLALSVLTIAIAAASFGAMAQTDAAHSLHHPKAQANKSPKAAAKAPNPATKEAMMAMDSKMKAMQEMHEKMMAATTPEERMALMSEHMNMMKDGMAMMGDMSAKRDMKNMGAMKSEMPMDMATYHEMMDKRMAMMMSMMQMMMDRLTPPDAK